jgi:uncharacterized coiled-coil DUF342 family protein
VQITPIPEELTEEILGLKKKLEHLQEKLDRANQLAREARDERDAAYKLVGERIEQIADQVGKSYHAKIDDTCRFVVTGV